MSKSSGPVLAVWSVGGGHLGYHQPVPPVLLVRPVEVEVDDVVEHSLLVLEEPRAAKLAWQLASPRPPLSAVVNKILH